MRCTRSTLMYKGGQADFSTHAVWALVGTRVLRITDAVAVRRISASDVTVIINPLNETTATAPSAESFTASSLPEGWLKRITSADRVLGSGHLDTPIGESEKKERSNLIKKTANRLAFAALKDPSRRTELAATISRDLGQLFLTRGTDAVNAHIAANSDLAPLALIRSLMEQPSLADLAGAPSSSTVRSTQIRPTEALAAIDPIAGNVPARHVVVQPSDPRSVHPHAVARWLQRVAGVIDDELVDATRTLLKSSASRAAAQEASAHLNRLLTERGINADTIKAARLAISQALSDPMSRALDDPARPVFSDRRAHGLAAENDRALLRANVAGTQIEFSVRAASLGRSHAGREVVTLEVITMWEVAPSLLRADPWVDESIPAEHRERWAAATQDRLISIISNR